jgi:16S rRNA (uracil1498-N3)-methyltransferase
MLTQFQRLVISPDQCHDRQILLTEPQRHYLQRVLRLQPGDRFIAMDGQGHAWIAAITVAGQAELLEAMVTQNELPVAVTLVAALPKGTGFDDVVRQATEIGVASIVPVISDRTLLKPSPQKLERWRRIAQEAAEQAERQLVPPILDPIDFASYLNQPDRPTTKFICVTRAEAPSFLTCLQNSEFRIPNSEFLKVAIGPEGGWTESEVESAIAAGYQPVSLGKRILRAVTAPIVALALIAAVLEERAID